MDRRALLTGSLALAAVPLVGQAKARKHKDKTKRTDKRKRTPEKGPSRARVDGVLGPLCEHMVHGLTDDDRSLEDLEAMLAAGQRIVVQCSKQSMLAIRALGRAGITARMVNPLWRGDWTTTDSWGHTSMEVRMGDHWEVFDPTGNAQLVDRRGRGMDVSTACRTRPILTRPFAADPLWAWEGPGDLLAYYEKIFQIPVVEHAGYWRFHDTADRARIEAIHFSWRWASREEWRKLTS